MWSVNMIGVISCKCKLRQPALNANRFSVEIMKTVCVSVVAYLEAEQLARFPTLHHHFLSQ